MADETLVQQGEIQCHACGGKGHVKCNCPDTAMVLVPHPLNYTHRDTTHSNEGFCIQQCRRCGRVRGLYHQWDAGTGSDDQVVDLGFVDPATITERPKSGRQ